MTFIPLYSRKFPAATWSLGSTQEFNWECNKLSTFFVCAAADNNRPQNPWRRKKCRKNQLFIGFPAYCFSLISWKRKVYCSLMASIGEEAALGWNRRHWVNVNTSAMNRERRRSINHSFCSSRRASPEHRQRTLHLWQKHCSSKLPSCSDNASVGRSCRGLLWCNKFNFLPLGWFTKEREKKKSRRHIKLKSSRQRSAVNFPSSSFDGDLLRWHQAKRQLEPFETMETTTWQLECEHSPKECFSERAERVKRESEMPFSGRSLMRERN